MRIIIIGSVAAGTSVAAKARRNSEECEIVIYEKDRDISYSACGLPYYIGQKGIKRSDLTPRDPCWFKKRFNMDVKTGHEVLTIDPARKSIEVKDYHTGEIFEDFYDKLVIATGASPIKPDITGIDNDNVFAVRNIESADKIIGYIAKTSPKKAVIIGGGYIGLELLENLINRGIDVVLVEREKSLAGKLDRDISIYLEEYLKEKKIKFLLGEEVSEIAYKKVITKSGKSIEADFVVSCTGVHPNSKLAEDIGIETFDNGAIKNQSQVRNKHRRYICCGGCRHGLVSYKWSTYVCATRFYCQQDGKDLWGYHYRKGSEVQGDIRDRDIQGI